ncbi:MAG: DNA-binding protein, partial [Actinomycetota bacterium]|nr:DNA-binding protein [Actinomycetota bacterium]
AAWRRLDLDELPLTIVDSPDRRVARAAVALVAREAADGETEVTVLIPRRIYRRFWHRLLHGRTAEEIAGTVSRLPHVNVSFVPYRLGRRDGAAQATKGPG